MIPLKYSPVYAGVKVYLGWGRSDLNSHRKIAPGYDFAHRDQALAGLFIEWLIVVISRARTTTLANAHKCMVLW